MQDPPFWLIAFAFPLFWVALSWVMSQLLGWAQLARFYQAYHRPEGERYPMRSMEFGPLASYGNAVNVSLSPEGIHLSMIPIFRVGHPPLLLPWSSLTGINDNVLFKSVRGLQLQLEVEGKTLKVYLPHKSRPTIDRYAPRQMLAARNIATSSATESVNRIKSG